MLQFADVMMFRLRAISARLTIVTIALVSILLVQRSDQLVAATIANCLNLPVEDSLLSSLCNAFALKLEANPQVALAQGIRLTQAGRFSEAELLLRRAYLARPSGVTASHWAQALGATGQFEEMALLFESGRHTAARDASFLSQAHHHAIKGAWALAQALYEQATAEQLAAGLLPDWMRAEAGWLLVRRLQTELDRAVPSEEGYWHYRLGRAYARLGRWRDAGAHLATALEVNAALKPADQLQALVKLSQVKAALGDWAGALETLQQAYGSGGRRPELMLQLITSLRRASDEGKARRLEQELAQLGPRFAINAPMTDGWTLWGYDLDELELEEGPEVTFYLYWHRNDGRCDPCLIVEPYHTLNLAFDGSFEWSARGQPSGPEASLGPGESCSSFVAQRERSGTATSVLFIPRATEGDGSSISGCYSPKAAVESGAICLLRGLITGQGQSVASFALIWGAWGRPGFPSQGSDYAVQGPVAEWQGYHTITTAPQEATFGLVRMMHQQTAGWVAYDNVLFVRLPKNPEQLQARNGEHLSGPSISALVSCDGCQ